MRNKLQYSQFIDDLWNSTLLLGSKLIADSVFDFQINKITFVVKSELCGLCDNFNNIINNWADETKNHQIMFICFYSSFDIHLHMSCFVISSYKIKFHAHLVIWFFFHFSFFALLDCFTFLLIRYDKQPNKVVMNKTYAEHIMWEKKMEKTT